MPSCYARTSRRTCETPPERGDALTGVGWQRHHSSHPTIARQIRFSPYDSGVQPRLFADVKRTNGRPGLYSEDSFAFLDRAAGVVWDRIRGKLDE